MDKGREGIMELKGKEKRVRQERERKEGMKEGRDGKGEEVREKTREGGSDRMGGRRGRGLSPSSV